MASEKGKPAVTPESLVQTEVAAAVALPGTTREELLSKKTLDTLMNANPATLIAPNPDAEIIKGSANPAGLWLHSPAYGECNAAADGRFQRITAQAFGKEVSRVERLHVRLVPGTKIVVIQPALSNDLSALPVNRWPGSSAAWVNMITLLAEAELTVDTGFRQYYELAYVPKGSPLWPAVFFDLGKPKARRAEGKKKEEVGSADAAAKTTASAKNKRSRKVTGASTAQTDPNLKSTDPGEEQTPTT